MLVMKWKWNKVQFEAIAPWANAHCELKVKQHSVWSYCSLSYCSLWTESETTFSLKLLLLELLLIVNRKWNNIPLKLSLIELLLIVNWKWNNIPFEAIAHWAIAHCELKVKQHSVWSYCSLSYCSLWTESETTVSLKISLISELSLITWKGGGESHRPSVADITPWAIARDLKRISFYRPKHYVLLTCKMPALSINTFSILYLYFFLLYLFKFCLLLKCSP